MKIKRFLTLLFALTLVFALAACNSCAGHVDANDDHKCDNCGESYDDGDEVPETVTVNVTFNVKLDSGDAAPGVSFTLTRGDNTFSFVSDEDGKVTATLEPGSYSLNCGNYTTDTRGFKITKDTTSFDFIVSNSTNMPDGSASNPFFISENNTEVIIAPGEEIYYISRRSHLTYVKIFAEGIVINYNGVTYSYSEETNSVTMSFEAEDNRGTVFSIKNVSTESITTTMKLEAPLGSRDNPEALTGNSASVSVSETETVYYRWTSDKNGVLVLTSETEKNSISITKVVENDVIILSETGGRLAAYLVVSAGDEIVIGVSVTGSTEKVNVGFNLATYAGTEADPVPVIIDEIDISIDAGKSIVFKSESGKTLTIEDNIEDERYVSVINNGATYSNNEGQKISFKLAAASFVIRNDADHINGITIVIK